MCLCVSCVYVCVCVCVCVCCVVLNTHRRFGEKTSRAVQASLVVILLGVGVATISDVDMNLIGSVFAACAVVCTSLGQIFTNSKPKELGLDSMQLLYHVSPIITLFMLILIPLGSFLPGFDQVVGERSLSQFKWTAPVVCWIKFQAVPPELSLEESYPPGWAMGRSSRAWVF